MDDTFKPGPGRKPPPVEHRFLKGTSGNKKGRPKGSVDLKKLTRKVALKKHAVKVDGKIVRKMLLQLVIESTAREAAAGVPSMVALIGQIRAKGQSDRGQAGRRPPACPSRPVDGRIDRAGRSSKCQRA